MEQDTLQNYILDLLSNNEFVYKSDLIIAIGVKFYTASYPEILTAIHTLISENKIEEIGDVKYRLVGA